ncbi:MAG: histidine kinase [Eubacteriales bacterium]|nr:histidine kinase [Eubacteriales bacterium]
MKRIKAWISHLSVKKKLIFYGYLTITPVLIIICLVLLLANYKKVLAEQLENDLSSVDILADSIHALQTEVKDFSTYICINNDIQQLLTADDPQTLNENANLWKQYAPMQIVQDMIALKGHIKTIAIYPENGVRPYLRCMDGSAYVSDREQIHQSTIYRETLDSSNGMVWKLVPKGSGETYETNRSDKVVLYREIFDLSQKKTRGYIVIGVSQETFRKLCQKGLHNQSEAVLVLDKSGGELCRVGQLDQRVEDYLTSPAFTGIKYSRRNSHFPMESYEIICRQVEHNASIVCKVVPRYGLRMQLLDVVNMPIALLAGFLVGLLPLLLIISNIVTRPLKTFGEAIEQFSAGDFQQQIPVTTHDELGQLAACFNRMVEDIRKLIDENYVITLRERESELAVLQAQINPHFLYNALDSLYWQAVEADNEEIAESILALSQLFRLVLNKGEKEVTVAQETELIGCYLQIQKMRFGKKLAYEIQVEPRVSRARIPKLILQPFVENAIVHGFENAAGSCFLSVTGAVRGRDLCFEIRDNGVGMTQAQIDAVWEQENTKYSHQRIGRYAIKNIRQRLQMKYHEQFRLEIHSQIGKGTTVQLTIPWEGENAP